MNYNQRFVWHVIYCQAYKDTAEIEAFEWVLMELKSDEVLIAAVQMWCVRNDASQEWQLRNGKTFNSSAIVYVNNGR